MVRDPENRIYFFKGRCEPSLFYSHIDCPFVQFLKKLQVSIINFNPDPLFLPEKWDDFENQNASLKMKSIDPISGIKDPVRVPWKYRFMGHKIPESSHCYQNVKVF